MDLKAVILDNEWVIVKNDWGQASKLASRAYGEPLSGRDYKKALQIPCTRDGKPSNVLAEYSAGRMNQEVFWDSVLESFGIERSKENIRIMQEGMKNLITEVDSDSIETIKNLKKQGYRVLMLSNSNPEISEGNLERNSSYYDLFDHYYLSYQLGCRKPEREIYNHVLRQEGLQGPECLFVDDKEENLVSARQSGMKVMYYKLGEGKLSNKLGFLIKNGR